MAQKFLIPAGGNFSSDTSWSTSSGGANNTTHPTAVDDAVIDNLSGQLTVDVSSACLSFSASTFTGTMTWASFTLTVSGNCTFGASMTFASQNTSTNLQMIASGTLTTNGKALPTTFGISLGTLTLGDDLNCTANHFAICALGTSGVIDLNGHKILGNSSVNRVLISSGVTGTARTLLNVLSTSFTNADFRDVQFTSAVDLDLSAITGKSGDCGGNTITGGGTNLTFTTPVNNYVGAYLTGSSLRMPGVAGFFPSAPDSVPLSITGDITLDIKLSMDDWTPALTTALISKSGSVSTVSYVLTIGTTGFLSISTSVLGTTLVTSTSSVAVGLVDGSTKWVRVSLQVNDGGGNHVTKFYLSDDGSTWIQLGTTVTTAGTTSIFDGSTVLEIGSNRGGTVSLLTGNVFNARVYNSYLQNGSGTPVFNADFTAPTIGTNNFVESSANAAVVTINAASLTISTAAWSTRVPLPQDDVKISNAFIASRIITLDVSRLGKNIDFTGTTGNPAINASVSPQIFGSLTLVSGMTSTATSITYMGRSTHTITTAGVPLAGSHTITAFGGTYTLQDAFSCTTALSVNNGTFTTNNFSVTCSALNSNSGVSRTINLGSSTVSITQTTTGNVISTNGGLTLNAGTSNIVLATASANARTMLLGGYTYSALTYTVAGSTGGLTITGNNTFNVAFNFSDASNARTVLFTGGSTQTLLTGAVWNVNGTPGKLMTVTSTTTTNWILNALSGVVSSDYLSLDHSTGLLTSPGVYYAGANSTDNGNNINWFFTAAPVLTTLGIKPTLIVGQTSRTITDQGITYNQTGVTYNDIRYSYGGASGQTDVLPMSPSALDIMPSVI